MVFCGILWKKAFAGWGVEGMANVREYLCGATFGRVEDETNTKFISRAFQTQGDHYEKTV